MPRVSAQSFNDTLACLYRALCACCVILLDIMRAFKPETKGSRAGWTGAGLESGRAGGWCCWVQRSLGPRLQPLCTHRGGSRERGFGWGLGVARRGESRLHQDRGLGGMACTVWLSAFTFPNQPVLCLASLIAVLLRLLRCIPHA